MNEAARCDRISLMHAGKVLAQDVPEALVRARHKETLEEAFIAYLEDATDVAPAAAWSAPAAPAARPEARASSPPPADRSRFDARRLWAYARRETMEIVRDPIRLAFALLGPALLMLVFGFGISFDVDQLSFAVLDRDGTPASRAYVDDFAGSPYFAEQKAIRGYGELDIGRIVALGDHMPVHRWAARGPEKARAIHHISQAFFQWTQQVGVFTRVILQVRILDHDHIPSCSFYSGNHCGAFPLIALVQDDFGQLIRSIFSVKIAGVHRSSRHQQRQFLPPGRYSSPGV